MLIVGSYALAHFGLSRNPPKDNDLWFSQDGLEEFNSFNEHTKASLSRAKFSGGNKFDTHVLPDEILNLVPCDGYYATPDAIYTIKCSHLAWDIHWEKTKNDILYLKAKGCTLIPELYTALKKHWLVEHGNKDFLSLKKPKQMFFNDYVHYEYPHDEIHELVAYPNKPIYTYCLKENEDVLIDKNKFDKMDFADKVRMFREEITVIACERWLLNPKNNETDSWFIAYKMSLKKVIINLTKNWANDFIIHNLEFFVKPDYSYFKHLLETLLMKEPIDLTPFEELQRALGIEVDEDYDSVSDTLVYALCIDSSYFEDYVDDMPDETDYETVLKTFNYDLLDCKEGSEGEGENCWGVFQLKDKIYKAEYSYYSYNGDEYAGIARTLRVVKPRETLITIYE